MKTKNNNLITVLSKVFLFSILFFELSCGKLQQWTHKTIEKIPAYETNFEFEHPGIGVPEIGDIIPVDIPSLLKIRFLNPYKNYEHYFKGQIHSHSKRSDGKLKPKKVLKYYKERGYFFISLTDHDDEAECWQIFKDPKISNIVYTPGEEGGKGHRTHFIELNLTKCPPSGNFNLKKWNYHTVKQGGLTVAPHPLSSSHTWSEQELFDLEWLGGIEIKNNTSYIELWDRLLTGDRRRWGFCVDDFHRKANINHGWIMVNSEDDNPNRFDLFANIKNGNFYSVLAPNQYNMSHPFPQFYEIKADRLTRKVTVSFSGANKVRFIGRTGVLKTETGFSETSSSEINTVEYLVNGKEGYIRVELYNTNEIYTFSQPIFVYGESPEDCTPINNTALNIQSFHYDGSTAYRLSDNSSVIAIFKSRNDAEKARDLIRFYKIDQMCFIGRPSQKIKMSYLKSSGLAPTGNFQDEDALSFNLENLAVSLEPMNYGSFNLKSWKLIDGNSPLLSFDDSEIQARRAKEIINRYSFNRICFIGRPYRYPFGMMYFRK